MSAEVAQLEFKAANSMDVECGRLLYDTNGAVCRIRFCDYYSDGTSHADLSRQEAVRLRDWLTATLKAIE